MLPFVVVEPLSSAGNPPLAELPAHRFCYRAFFASSAESVG